MASKVRCRDVWRALATTAIVGLVSGSSGTTADAAPHVFLSPAVSSLGWGESVAIDVFIEDVTDLRLYEIVLEVTGGQGGTLDLTDLTIDEQRGDFVFAGIPSLVCIADSDNRRITCTPLSDDCVSVPAGTPAYLGTYLFTASTGTSATFGVNIADEPSTFLLDCAGTPITPFTLTHATVEVSVPVPLISLSPELSTIRAGESVEIDVFIENVAGLRLYEVVLDVTGGVGGSLDVTDLIIDEGRGDFVFTGIPSPVCITDPDNLRITCTPLSDDCADVAAGAPAYLGTYTFTANTDVPTTFGVNIIDAPTTIVLDCNGNTITPFTLTHAAVDVEIPDPHIFLSPEVASLGSGESIEIDVFVEDVGDLRLYEVVLQVTGGASGSLDVTDLTIDEERGDFVFAGISSLVCIADSDNLRITCTPLSDDCVTATAPPAYLGTYTFTRGPGGASGEFSVNIVAEPTSFLLDCVGDRITPFTVAQATVRIRAVPAVSEWGMVSMTLLAMVLATIMLTRRSGRVGSC